MAVDLPTPTPDSVRNARPVRFRVVDIVFVVLAVGVLVNLALVHLFLGPSFREMLTEFNIPLSRFSQIVFHPAFLTMAELLGLGLLACGIRSLLNGFHRRGLGFVVSALVVGVAFGAILLGAYVLPDGM